MGLAARHQAVTFVITAVIEAVKVIGFASQISSVASGSAETNQRSSIDSTSPSYSCSYHCPHFTVEYFKANSNFDFVRLKSIIVTGVKSIDAFVITSSCY